MGVSKPKLRMYRNVSPNLPAPNLLASYGAVNANAFGTSGRVAAELHDEEQMFRQRHALCNQLAAAENAEALAAEKLAVDQRATQAAQAQEANHARRADEATAICNRAMEELRRAEHEAKATAEAARAAAQVASDADAAYKRALEAANRAEAAMKSEVAAVQEAAAIANAAEATLNQSAHTEAGTASALHNLEASVNGTPRAVYGGRAMSPQRYRLAAPVADTRYGSPGRYRAMA